MGSLTASGIGEVKAQVLEFGTHASNLLERATGVGGEIDLMVSAKDLTKPATIEWMSSYESAVLKRFGYSSTRGCGKARLCPAFSLPDLFQGASTTTTGAAGGAGAPTTTPKGGSSSAAGGAGAATTTTRPLPKLSRAAVAGLLSATGRTA